MISKKKSIRKRHDGTVPFSSEEITAAKCQASVKASNAHDTTSTGNKADAKKKRSRFVVTSVVEKLRESVDDAKTDDRPTESSDQKDDKVTSSEKNETSVRDRRINDILEYKKSSSLDESRGRVKHSERSRKISSVVQPLEPLLSTEEMRREPHSESYVMQSVFYCQPQIPLIQVSPAQIIPIDLLSENPRRTVSQCLFPFEVNDRLNPIRDRSVPSLRSANARLYEKYNVGLTAAKENLRRYCLSRLSESRSAESVKPLEISSRNLSSQINSIGEVCQNEASCATFSGPLRTGTLFANEDKHQASIQHCATIIEDPRPEEAVVSIPSDSVAVPCESTTEQQPQVVKTNVPLNQIRSQHQPQQQQQQKPLTIHDKQKVMLNRRRQSDLGSIAMMQRKIKVNGTTDVINFDDLRERLEQLTGTTCCGVGSTNSGPGATASNGSKNKKNVITDKSNGLAKLSHAASRTKLNSQGESGPLFAGRNQRHNSIAVVENQEVQRLLELGQSTSNLAQSQDSVASLKPSPTGTSTASSSSSHFHHSQSTMALSSLVSASTQTSSDAVVNTSLRRHSNYDVPSNLSAPTITLIGALTEVGTLGGSRLDDSLSLDDVVALIQAGDPLYDISTEESFWQQLSEGFEGGRFQVVSKEESNEVGLSRSSFG